MRRTLLILLLGLGTGLAAHFAWMAERRPAPAPGLAGDLAWMQANLHLSGEQFAQLQALHEQAVPRLIDLAIQEATMRRELDTFEAQRRTVGRIDFIEFARFVEHRRALDRACLESTRALVTASADLMTPAQRGAYLTLLQPAVQADRVAVSN